MVLPDDPLILLIGLVTLSNISLSLETQLVWFVRAKKIQLSCCLGIVGFDRDRRVSMLVIIVGFCILYELIYKQFGTESGTL